MPALLARTFGARPGFAMGERHPMPHAPYGPPSSAGPVPADSSTADPSIVSQMPGFLEALVGGVISQSAKRQQLLNEAEKIRALLAQQPTTQFGTYSATSGNQRDALQKQYNDLMVQWAAMGK